MMQDTDSLFKDKVYLFFAAAAVLLSAITYYLFNQLFSRNSGVWLAPLFTPIHYYVTVVFAINLALSFISYKRDRFLSLAFNFTTISVNALLVLALLINVNNPNG
jgi:hypothetical protein